MKKLVEAKRADSATFEDVLDKLGMPGRFQIVQLTLGLLSMFIQTYMALAFVFLGHEPAHVCNKANETDLLSRRGLGKDTNVSIEYETCDIVLTTNQNGSYHDVKILGCPDGRDFSDAKHTTWLSEWDLVCDSKGLAELSFTCYNAGLIIGGLFWSAMADRIGRKPVVILCAFMCTFWEGVILLAPNIYVINGLRFVSGVFRQGVTEAYFILGLEFLATRHRDLYGVIVCYKWVFDVLLVGFTAYIFQDYDWKYLQAMVPLSGVFAILFPFFMEESPRWLTAKNRCEDALKIIKRACHQNGKSFEEVNEVYQRFVSTELSRHHKCREPLKHNSDSGEREQDLVVVETKRPNSENVTILTLFSTRKLAISTLSSWVIWIANNMTYYGLFMVSSTLVGNRFLNFSLVAIVEIPTCSVILVMMRKMERLLVVKIFLTCAAFSLLAYSLLNTFGGDGSGMAAANIIAFVLGKFCITASYYVLFILTPEIYPTTLRTTATASCSSISRIGSMLVPFMRPLITVVEWGPGVVFTVVCFIALGLMTFLPETKGKALVDTVEEFQSRWSKKQKQGPEGKRKDDDEEEEEEEEEEVILANGDKP